MEVHDLVDPPPKPQGVAAAGARPLFILRLIEVGWWIAMLLIFRLAPSLSGSRFFEGFGLFNQAVWSLLTTACLVLMIPFWHGRRGTAAEKSAQLALIVAGVLVGVELIEWAVRVVPMPGAFLRVVSVGAALAFDLAFWSALMKSQQGAPAWLGPTYLGLRLTGFALSLPGLMSMLSPDLYDTGLGAFVRSGVVSWGHQALSLAGLGCVLWVLYRLTRQSSGRAASTAGSSSAEH